MDYKFFYCWLDGEKWQRDAVRIEGFWDFDAALQQFWHNRDRENLRYAGGFQGDLTDLSEPYFDDADEFSMGPLSYEPASKAFKRMTDPLEDYTVVAVFDTGEGFKRNIEWYSARSPIHAELMGRMEHEDAGHYQVCAVLSGFQEALDDTMYLYATKTGHSEKDPVEVEDRQVEAKAYELSHPKKKWYQFWKK